MVTELIGLCCRERPFDQAVRLLSGLHKPHQWARQRWHESAPQNFRRAPMIYGDIFHGCGGSLPELEDLGSTKRAYTHTV